MSKSNTWDKLSTILSNVLSDSVAEDERESVMDGWNKQKTAVAKLLTTASKPKKAKDPNAPKRGKSSYIFYCMDKRPGVKEDNPDMSAKEITSTLGTMWNELGDKKKTPYAALAVKDKARYAEAISNYTPPEGSDYAVPKSAKKERTGPKKALSSYMQFSNSMRAQVKADNPELLGTAVTSELGKMWRGLDDEGKKPYVKMYEKDKVRYEREKSELSGESTSVVEKKSSKKTVSKSKSKTVETVDEEPAKVKRASKSASKSTSKATSSKATPGYNLFMDQEREDVEDENPDWSNRKVTSTLNKMWGKLSSEDRDAYEMEATDDGFELDE